MTPPTADGHRRDDSQASYYFVSHEAGTSEAVRDAGDEGEVIEEMPAGTNPDIFSPRIVNAIVSIFSSFFLKKKNWRLKLQ
jgi:hypothetical protein